MLRAGVYENFENTWEKPRRSLEISLGIAAATIARYETDRTPGAPMLKRLIDLARQEGKDALATSFQTELRMQVAEWMGVGAAARSIYKKTLRPNVLAEIRARVRNLQKELDLLSMLLTPEGEATDQARAHQGEQQVRGLDNAGEN